MLSCLPVLRACAWQQVCKPQQQKFCVNATEAVDVCSPDGIFASPLADLSYVSSRKAICVLHQQSCVHIISDRRLSQDCLEDLRSAALIWKRNVNELI